MKDWTIGQTIRHIKTGHAYLVVAVVVDVCIFVIDLQSKTATNTIIGILQRDYGDFAPDKAIDVTETRINGESHLTYEKDSYMERLLNKQITL